MTTPAAVTFDEVAVTHRPASGPPRTVRWADLRRVIIETNHDGPAVNDLFWILHSDPGGCVVPGDTEGCIELLERLMELPGFDHETSSGIVGSDSTWTTDGSTVRRSPLIPTNSGIISPSVRSCTRATIPAGRCFAF